MADELSEFAAAQSGDDALSAVRFDVAPLAEQLNALEGPSAAGAAAAADSAAAAADESDESDVEESEQSDAPSSGARAKTTAVEVFVRVRPRNDLERDDADGWTWSAGKLVSASDDKKEFDYGEQHVFTPDSTTEDVYARVGLPVVENCMQGYNGYIFAYGQTSSGKTYTMFGDAARGRSGVVKLAVTDIFRRLAGKAFLLTVSMLEIYNEHIRDLLGKDKDVSYQVVVNEKEVPMIQVRRHASAGIIQMASAVEASSIEQVMQLIARGMKRRSEGRTDMNEHSSRSHMLFRLTVIIEGTVPLASDLFLIDLAGSENAKQSGATGERQKEAANINKSLTALVSVVKQLIERQTQRPGAHKTHVRFRDSKLTQFLQPALGGNAMTAIICNVSPAARNAAQTASTLRFAKSVCTILNRQKRNSVEVGGALYEEMQGKLASMQDEVEESRKEQERLNNELLSYMAKIRAQEERIQRLEALGGDASVQTMVEKERLEREKRDVEAQRDELQKRLNEQKASEEKLKRLLPELEVQRKERERLAGLVVEQERITRELQQRLEENGVDQATLSELHARQAKLTKERQEEIERFRGTLTTTRDVVQSVVGQIGTLDSRNKEATARANERIAAAHRRLQAMAARLQEREAEEREASTRAARERDELRGKVSALVTERDDAERRAAALEERLRERDQAERSETRAAQELAEVREEMQRVRAQLAAERDMRSRNDADSAATIERVEAAVAAVRGERQRLQDTLRAREEELATTQLHLERVREQLLDETRSHQETRSALTDLRNEFHELQAHRDQLQAEVDDFLTYLSNYEDTTADDAAFADATREAEELLRGRPPAAARHSSSSSHRR